MTVLPIAVGATIKKTNETHKYYGYINEMILLTAFAFIGFMFNIWLYVDDLKNRGGQLDKVPSSKDDGEGGITDMMTSPATGRRQPGDAEIDEFDITEEN